MKESILALIVLLGLPSLGYAQAYKCSKPNGSVAFQDHPCQSGTAESSVQLVPAQSYSSQDARKAMGNPSMKSSAPAQSASDAAKYPYAQPGDVERLKAMNADLQADTAKMRAENPNWEKSQVLKRMNDRAAALNAQIQEK